MYSSRDRRQRSVSPAGRDRRRVGGSRSRSPHSRSPVTRRSVKVVLFSEN